MKHQYIRSKKLMEACREIECQNCGKDDGTVCGAHSNQGKHGKGKGIKADDNMVAALCFWCHMEIDQGSSMSRQEREEAWEAAHLKTVNRLVELGLWPDDVPVP
jgi:hypothetical protein